MLSRFIHEIRCKNAAEHFNLILYCIGCIGNRNATVYLAVRYLSPPLESGVLHDTIANSVIFTVFKDECRSPTQ